MSMMDFEKGHMPVILVLEVHRHGAAQVEVFSNGNQTEVESAIGFGERQTVNCVFDSVNWTHSTSAPYENLNITMRFTGRTGDPYFEQELLGRGGSAAGLPIPQINDWVILKSFSRDSSEGPLSLDTIFFARIHKARGDHRADPMTGIVDKTSVALSCEGFFDFLGKNNVCVGFLPTKGTLYGISDWIQIKRDILQDMLGENVDIVGTRFERLFKALAKIRLPQTLAQGERLGDAVRVVFNQSKSNNASGG